jgi:hypothetical protein
MKTKQGIPFNTLTSSGMEMFSICRTSVLHGNGAGSHQPETKKADTLPCQPCEEKVFVSGSTDSDFEQA